MNILLEVRKENLMPLQKHVERTWPTTGAAGRTPRAMLPRHVPRPTSLLSSQGAKGTKCPTKRRRGTRPIANMEMAVTAAPAWHWSEEQPMLSASPSQQEAQSCPLAAGELRMPHQSANSLSNKQTLAAAIWNQEICIALLKYPTTQR